MDYIFDKYIEPVSIKNKISYIKIVDVSKYHICELAKIYCSLFNSDNKAALTKLSIPGRTIKEGLWDEAPYTLDMCKKIIKDFTTSDYFGVVAVSKNINKDLVIGASIYQIRNIDELKDKDYKIPFDINENKVDLWCEVDTFRRDVVFAGQKVKYLSNKMRSKTLQLFKNEKSVLIYSSTNNPIMVKSWKKDGFTVIEKTTTFGNRFQAFKLIK